MKHTIEIDPGSFMGNAWQPNVTYVFSDDKTPLCIGKVSRVARNRYKWSRYAKPPKHSTKAKAEPKVAEHHYVSRESTAVWAIKLSHHNSTKGGAPK